MANIRATTPASATRISPALGEATVDAVLIWRILLPHPLYLRLLTLTGEDLAEAILGVQVWYVELRAPPALRHGEDEPVVVGPAVPFRLGIQEPQERPHHHPVEFGVYACAQLLPGLHGLHAGTTGLVQHHGSVGLCHGEYPGFERYPGTAQLVRVSPAVGTLVVPPDPGGHLFELGNRSKRLFAAGRVLCQPALGDGV